jgi:hypothetical protein
LVSGQAVLSSRSDREGRSTTRLSPTLFGLPNGQQLVIFAGPTTPKPSKLGSVGFDVPFRANPRKFLRKRRGGRVRRSFNNVVETATCATHATQPRVYRGRRAYCSRGRRTGGFQAWPATPFAPLFLGCASHGVGRVGFRGWRASQLTPLLAAICVAGVDCVAEFPASLGRLQSADGRPESRVRWRANIPTAPTMLRTSMIVADLGVPWLDTLFLPEHTISVRWILRILAAIPFTPWWLFARRRRNQGEMVAHLRRYYADVQ